jgi:hypothetical protein
MGLSAAAGLNAYIPLLVVGLLDRADLITLPAPYDGLAETPVLIVLAVLLAIEVGVDKVPGVDSVNDVVQTVIRPAAGGLLAAGSLGVLTDLPPWVGLLAGIVAAGGVHAGKSAARPVVNVATAGAGAPVVSVVEDGTSAVASVLAVLAPVLLLVLTIVLAVVGWRWWRARRSRRACDDVSPR